MTDPIELVGTAEVALMLGVTRQRVLQLARTEGFPLPVARLSMGNVWLAGDIRTWLQRREAGRSGP